MTDNRKQQIQILLNHTHIGFLSTQGNNSPETSMCPYAIHHGDILLHLSSLAKHSKNIAQKNRVGFMICTPETEHTSLLSLPRLSFTGCIKPIQNNQAQRCYLNKIPDSESLFSFSDFSLYYIQVEKIYWVGGFGKAQHMTKEIWESLC